MLCGIAKDLTKLGGKTVTKLVTPEEKQTKLFHLVSLITGWKNSLKGMASAIVDQSGLWTHLQRVTTAAQIESGYQVVD
jgi:hypothetical protein